jgi:hypothetical protein
MRVTGAAPLDRLAPPRSRSAEPQTDRPFAAVLAERTAAAPATAPSAPRAETQPAPARALVTRALAAETEIDALLNAAARGRTFSAAELLALQATVFRYSQTVEIVSRVADRLVGAVKQTMSTQV